MNERIKELIEECTDRHFSECIGGFETFDKEKFAELIVAECCEILSKETIRHDGYGYNQHALHRKIKEHFFGVEE